MAGGIQQLGPVVKPRRSLADKKRATAKFERQSLSKWNQIAERATKKGHGMQSDSADVPLDLQRPIDSQIEYIFSETGRKILLLHVS